MKDNNVYGIVLFFFYPEDRKPFIINTQKNATDLIMLQFGIHFQKSLTCQSS